MNPYSEHDRLDAQMAACFAAVAKVFCWLSVRDIVEPPHEKFDAAFARQIGLHVMIRHFHVPKRRVVAMQERSREAVNRALRTVDARLMEPKFQDVYAGIVRDAQAHFAQDMTRASSAA